MAIFMAILGSFANHGLRSKSAYMQSFAASFETLLRGGTFDPSICTQHFGAFGAFSETCQNTSALSMANLEASQQPGKENSKDL